MYIYIYIYDIYIYILYIYIYQDMILPSCMYDQGSWAGNTPRASARPCPRTGSTRARAAQAGDAACCSNIHQP